MKRLFLLISIFLLIFSFSACNGAQEELELLQAEHAKYVPYEELINALDEKNFEKVDALISGYKSTAYVEQLNNGEVQEITINKDNWSEYFEIKEITQWHEDDLGKTTGFVTSVCVILSDEYAERIVAEKTDVSFGWKATCSVKNCDVDLDNRKVSYENLFKSNSTTFGDPEVLKGTVSFDGTVLEEFDEDAVAAKIGEIVIVGEYSLQGVEKPVCFDYDDTAITQAKGVLTIYNDGE